jgi:hypothetical protein
LGTTLFISGKYFFIIHIFVSSQHKINSEGFMERHADIRQNCICCKVQHYDLIIAEALYSLFFSYGFCPHETRQSYSIHGYSDMQKYLKIFLFGSGGDFSNYPSVL